MYISFITNLAKIFNADFKEIELLVCLFLMTFFAYFYKWIPKHDNSKDQFLFLRLYGAIIGFIVHFTLLNFGEFMFFNICLFGFYYITQMQFKNSKIRLLVSFTPFVFLTAVNLFVFVKYYGDYYGTHFLMISMTTIPKMMYFFWESQGKKMILLKITLLFFSEKSRKR